MEKHVKSNVQYLITTRQPDSRLRYLLNKFHTQTLIQVTLADHLPPPPWSHEEAKLRKPQERRQ